MKLENNYLSDKELEQFILELEQNELVQAPPDLLEQVICQIEMISEIDSSDEIVDKTMFENETRKSKVKEFREYCFRVITSVAAAIVIVFLLPQLSRVEQFNILANKGMLFQHYQIKENSFYEMKILSQLLGEKNIFNNEKKQNIFNKKNGGF